MQGAAETCRLTIMTQVLVSIRNKRDLPFLAKLSKNMGWTISQLNAEDEPNETTLAAMREVESGKDLVSFDLDAFRRHVASL